MPTKTKSAAHRKKTAQPTALANDTWNDTGATDSEVLASISSTPKAKPQFLKIAVVVLVVAAVAALLLRNRGWFVAATVNGTPIPRWDLNKRLSERYGDQMLEAMIGEKLITDAATKDGVTASNEEIQTKIAEIEKSLSGSMKLDDALKLQGVTRAEFENQVRVQLLIDKMMSKEVSVSAAEVEEYVKSSTPAGKTLTASESAQQKETAEKEIRNNKIAEKFQEWFASLKNDAKINKYL